MKKIYTQCHITYTKQHNRKAYMPAIPSPTRVYSRGDSERFCDVGGAKPVTRHNQQHGAQPGTDTFLTVNALLNK